MKIEVVLCIIGIAVGGCEAFMRLNYFKNTILPKCYGWKDANEELENGQVLPIPSSIEAFVSLVEKIEELYPSWKPSNIISNLLLSFRYDDVEVIQMDSASGPKYQFQTRGSQDVSKAHEILLALFGNPGPTSDFRAEDLTDDERCALYFMISHTINDTARRNDVDVLENRVTKHPREQGVVSLGSRTRHAFALGKVLLGLLAGLQDIADVPAKDLLRRVSTNQQDDETLNGVNINVLYAATLGDIVSITKAKQTNRGDTYFLPNGYWNEAVCTTRYLLDENNLRYSSMSLLRGGIDGYILGKNIKQAASSKDFRLSQALRMYYSASGFVEMPQLSWCNRQSALKDLLQEAREMGIAYDKLYSAATDKVQETSIVEEQVRQVFDNIALSMGQLLEEASRESQECAGSDSTRGRMCETPTDVIAVLDWKTSEQQKQMQSEIIGNLTSGFVTGYPKNYASVFTNLKPQGSGQNLDTVINGTRCAGCAGCAVRYYQPIRSGSEPEPEVLRDLNRTLAEMDELQEEEPAVPAKVVLYFNYGSPQSDTQLREAVWDLEKYHKMTRIMAFGTKKDSLKEFVTEEDRDIEVGNNVQGFLPKLKERVCKVPAQFQFTNCFRRTDSEESSNKYDGFITPNNFQYWSMDPKYFHRSFNIKLIFRAVTGQIRVCYSRYYSQIFDNRDPTGDCKETGSDGVVTFSVSNPCHKRTVTSCNPFYFYVEGKAVTADPCVDKRCKSSNQIQFEFAHEGISCNSASSLSPIAVMLASLFLLSWRLLLHTK